MKGSKAALIIFGGLLAGAWFYKVWLDNTDPLHALRQQANSAKNGGQPEFKGTPKEVSWGDLRQLNYKSGHQAPITKEINGAYVKVAGFVVPLSDKATTLSEFLLVPTPMACIHTPAPPPNQIVLVKMGAPIEVNNPYIPFWVKGKLKIVDGKSEYGSASYELTGQGVEPYTEF